MVRYLCVSAVVAGALAAPAHAEPLIGFSSPSGNIGCYVAEDYVRCDIAERDWAPPPRPAGCEFDYGQGIAFADGDPPAFVCAGDTALHAGAPLAFGRNVAAGPMQCTSQETGVTCRDTRTGGGFTISRQAYELF